MKEIDKTLNKFMYHMADYNLPINSSLLLSVVLDFINIPHQLKGYSRCHIVENSKIPASQDYIFP